MESVQYRNRKMEEIKAMIFGRIAVIKMNLLPTINAIINTSNYGKKKIMGFVLMGKIIMNDKVAYRFRIYNFTKMPFVLHGFRHWR